MQKIIPIFFLLLCSVGCHKDKSIITSKNAIPEENATTSGTVHDLNDSSYVNDAIVLFNYFIDTTAGNGYFTFDSIPFGEYRIEISHPFYQSFISELVISENRNEKFYLTPLDYFITDTLYTYQGAYIPWYNNGLYNFTVKQTIRSGPEVIIFSSEIYYNGLFVFDTLDVFNQHYTTPIDSFFITGDRYAKFDVSDSAANLAKIKFIAEHDIYPDSDKEIVIETRENISEWVRVFYADREVTIEGYECSSNGLICMDTDLKLKKGWNYILESHDTGSEYVVVHYTTPSPDQNIRWLFIVTH
jgi:hypothetical protein